MIIHRIVEALANIPHLVWTGVVLFFAWSGGLVLVGMPLLGMLRPTAPPNSNGWSMVLIGSFVLGFAAIASCFWWYHFEEALQARAKHIAKEAERDAFDAFENALASRVSLRAAEKAAGLDPWPYDDELDIEILAREVHGPSYTHHSRQSWPPASYVNGYGNR